MSSSSTPPPYTSETIKNRRLGFLLWQSIATTAIYLLLSPIANPPSSLLPTLHSLLSFLTFHLSVLLLSLSLSLLSSPHPDPHASLPSLAAGLVRASIRPLIGGFSGPAWDADFRRQARKTLGFGVFLVVSAVSGFFFMVSVCGDLRALDWWKAVGLGLRGSGVGLVFGAYYLYRRRWVLQFPIIQRPLFFSFKIGISSSLQQALKLLAPAFLCSTTVMVFLPKYMKSKSTLGLFIIEQITFCIGTGIVIFCCELTHNLLQVVHTRRCTFAPPQGSAAAETNPSEALLESLEQSTPRSLLQYLAYLDLCLVSESNVEPWRRAAFFEETGETYRRIASACLRPLEQLTSRIGQALEGLPEDKSGLLSMQLTVATYTGVDSKLLEAFDDSQICTWCARSIAALTAHSHVEDRFGVAQLTGTNTAVVSTLLSCLLAVEVCLGKKTSPQPAHLMGPGNIRWATVNTGRQDVVAATTTKKRSGALHSKAYAMADVLRTSIYEIVSVFEADMLANAKASVLEKNWIAENKPLYGTWEILVHKLHFFLEFHAC